MPCRPEESAIPVAVSLLPLATNHASDVLDMPVDPNEPTYCLCHQVSYGEMIGCDNQDVRALLPLKVFFPPLHCPIGIVPFSNSILIKKVPLRLSWNVKNVNNNGSGAGNGMDVRKRQYGYGTTAVERLGGNKHLLTY